MGVATGAAASAAVSPIQKAAILYAKRGWPVFPLNGKQPFAGSRGFKDASTRWELIPKWPEGCNIGIATGSGLVVLDVDPEHGGEDTLRELQQKHGVVRTAAVETGSGGSHLYFTARGKVPCSAGRLGPGLDVRGDGGYVVAPPSVHPNGKRYEWYLPPSEVPISPMPSWLTEQVDTRRPAVDWSDCATSEVANGMRNTSAASLAGVLLKTGLSPQVTLALILGWNQRWCAQPLPEEEVERTVRSIARCEVRQWRT
jgi:hypothetical protein